MEQFEQYYRLPQDVVGHDAALLSYWDTMPARELAGGGVGPVRCDTLLGIIQLTDLNIGLPDGVLLRHVGGFQLGNLGQPLGLSHARLSQVGGSVL